MQEKKKEKKQRAGKINNEFNMCETEKTWLEESTCVNGELTERERKSAEREHTVTNSWRHLTNGKIQIAATVMYIERREPDEPGASIVL